MECRRYIEIKVSLCLCICLKRPAYFLGVLEWEGKRKEANISGVAWQRVGNPRVGWGGVLVVPDEEVLEGMVVWGT